MISGVFLLVGALNWILFSLGLIKNGIAGSYDKCIFSLMRNCHTSKYIWKPYIKIHLLKCFCSDHFDCNWDFLWWWAFFMYLFFIHIFVGKIYVCEFCPFYCSWSLITMLFTLNIICLGFLFSQHFFKGIKI